jgi:RNA polymerase primary sigma factor
MAQFIRDYCDGETRQELAVRRLHDRYVHYKHRLASANIRLAAHVAKRFRHHALSYSDLLQEAVCGLMQAIDRFDVSHGTRLATYATWWIRQTLQIAVARQSHLVSLSPHHLQELGCCSRSRRRWPMAASICPALRNWPHARAAAWST